MAAFKHRYDERFIAPRPEFRSRPVAVEALEQDASFVPSPARAMQDSLAARMGHVLDMPATGLDTRYDPRMRVAVIVGASSCLWAGIIAAGWALFG